MHFQNTRDNKIPNAYRKSEESKTQVTYKESETKGPLMFSTVIPETSLYVIKFIEKIPARLEFYAQIIHQLWG